MVYSITYEYHTKECGSLNEYISRICLCFKISQLYVHSFKHSNSFFSVKMMSGCHFFLLFCVFVFSSPKVTLEAEVTNKGALALYGRLGFIRAKRLFRYYLNGVDAFRLKLLFPQPELHPFLPMMADRDATQMHDDHSPTSEEFSELHRNL